MPIIDFYAHVSTPRFLSVEDCLRLMDTHDIEAAVLSTAETCPDVHELSRAIRQHPNRFRSVGMPLGADVKAICDNIRAQLDSGFSGIRLPAPVIARNPEVLDIIGQAGKFAIVVGESGLRVAATEIADFLDRYPNSFVVAGHFGGPADPALLTEDPSVARLFTHRSLYVAFTRHGAMSQLPVDEWAKALLARIGWGRVLWGSEWPVALWRNETYRSTLDWALRFASTDENIEAFRYGNAKRLLFENGPVMATPLAAAVDLMPFRRMADVWLFPPSLDVSEQRHSGIYRAYIAWGGESRGAYDEFIVTMAERGIAAMSAQVPGE
jgi:predicted TIM-barrel fold metal-dependent hydrolase